MKNVMDYETIDWDAQARRIGAAFGVKGECRFKDVLGQKGVVKLVSAHGTQKVELDAGSLLEVRAAGGSAFYYAIFECPDRKFNRTMIWATFSSGRMDECSQGHSDYTLPFVRALFCLDLLTPEIEAALKVSVTAHEKLEWRLEYEARYGL